MLRKEGFEVSVAATGTSALTQFDRTGADIVLLDLMLPEMSGTEVCRQIRQRSAVPIIMVTARDSEIDKVVGLEIGADDYVTKPYSPRELVARIRAVQRRPGAHPGPADRPGVGCRLRRRHQDPGRACQAAALQGRTGAVDAALHRHRARPRVQVRAVGAASHGAAGGVAGSRPARLAGR